MTKLVYKFGGAKTEGRSKMKNLLGGKGANLAEMASLGLPVPPGFTITTEVCTAFYENKKKYPADLKKQVAAGLKQIEETIGAKFGDAKNPLLVSVRSGARVSMPGMMDTVLNLGLNDTTVQGLAEKSGDARFAYDSYRRFIQMYANVVMGLEGEVLEHELEMMKHREQVREDTELTAENLRRLVELFKAKVKERLGKNFPDDPIKQLWGAVGAVFSSWETPRAITYRRLNGIPASWGTAVNVQAMVFGNLGDNCATGVAFTRDPSTGERKFFGEYLTNAQGEDVVAGIRTPCPINKANKTEGSMISLEEVMPKAYKELVKVYKLLEKHYRDMQDIEFTIQQGRLWMLQTRNGKRTARAALKIAVDMVKERLITREEAILRIEPDSLDQLLHKQIDPKAQKDIIARGLPASPGAAAGEIVFDADTAEKLAGEGKKVILVRIETSPEDIHGMHAAQGILTARGGMTSHAAVVARGMGKCCVSGSNDIVINYSDQTMRAGGRLFKKGDLVTLNGSSGEVMAGMVSMIEPELSGDFEKLMVWADKIRTLKVRTNADTPDDAKKAREFGAEGIGLCRTEHMFFEEDRISAVREMILAEDEEGRKKALMKILPYQKKDFLGIFRAMDGLPVTIRLLDPPLHEFLPHEEKDIEAMARQMGVKTDVVRKKVDSLQEFNPMLGFRGCRLGVIYPEIFNIQVRAIMEAACDLTNKGIKVIPEIMIPLVAHEKELAMLRANAIEVADAIVKRSSSKVKYKVGTMIELPRAALTADEIAVHADFFSFGTNDLTQTAFGLSRDDAGKFLPAYVEKNILPVDPFVALDQSGVGVLVKTAVKLGREVNPKMHLGICGEHGGEPTSVKFCHGIGLDYVSCSPFRVPIARFSAAQAVLEANLTPKSKKSAKKKPAAKKKAAPKKAAKSATKKKTAPKKKAKK